MWINARVEFSIVKKRVKNSQACACTEMEVEWEATSHFGSPPAANTAARRLPPPEAPSKPVEFLCPISGALMADPVLVSPCCQTSECSCIQACADLAFSPPGLSLDLRHSSLFLIANVALRSAILRQPVPPEAAYIRPRSLLLPPTGNSLWKKQRRRNKARRLPVCQPLRPPTSAFPKRSWWSNFWARNRPRRNPPLVLLRQVTRESRAHLTTLCKPRILAAVRSTSSSGSDAVQGKK